MQTKQLNFKTLIKELKPRERQSHKGIFGHVFIVGGDYGYAGAPILAALGALRAGAGLVTICTHQENTIGLSAEHPEIMAQAIDDTTNLHNILTKADVIVLGVGLGRSDWSQAVYNACSKAQVPLIIDADALFYLSQNPNTLSNRILTPHPGEAATLLNKTVSISLDDRLNALDQMVKKYSCTVVLKGADTLIASPKLSATQCSLGNPGMASGGMGDLLSGVIAALVAQGMQLDNAAQLGVCVHAMAGDLAAKEGQRGIIASDLLIHIHKILGS